MTGIGNDQEAAVEVKKVQTHRMNKDKEKSESDGPHTAGPR